MRARLAIFVGTLLILSAFGLPTTTAKTGDAVCSPQEIWFDDAEGDGGFGSEPDITPSGDMDIDTFTVAEVGKLCDHITFTLSTEDSTVTQAGDVVINVALAQAGTPDWSMDYLFGSDEVVLYKEGTAVEDETNVTMGANTDGSLFITINKTIFSGNTVGFVGVFAEVTDAGGAPEDTWTADTATDPRVLLVDFGLDADDDGMPDEWEKKTFGHTNQTSKSDKDGDGHGDLEEYLAGTDPLDPDDPPVPPAPYPTVTHLDTDGTFGMTGEYLSELLAPGESYSYTFDQSGGFPFFCDVHKTAGGSIQVQSTAASGGPRTYVMETYDAGQGSTADQVGFRVFNGTQAGLEDLSINRGDTVIFWNNGSLEHNVRSGNGEDFLEGDFNPDDESDVNAAYVATTSISVVVVVAAILVGLLGRWKP